MTSGIRARLATSESCLDSLSLLAGHASAVALEATESAFPEPNKSYPVQDLRLDTLKQPIYSATPLQFDQLPPLSLSHRNSVLIVQPPSLSLRVPQKSSFLSPKSKQHILGADPRVAQPYRQAAPAFRSRPLPRVKAISRRSREFYEQLRAANRRSAPPGLFPNAVKPAAVRPPVPFHQTLIKPNSNKQALSSSSTAQAKHILRSTPISPPIISETSPQQSDLNSNSKELQSETSAQPTASLHVESTSGTDTQQESSDLHNFEEVDQKLHENLSAQLESEATLAAAAVAAPAPTSSHHSPAHTRINYSDLIDPSAVLVLSASAAEPTSESSTPPPAPADLPHRPHQISPISEEEPADTSEDESYSIAPQTNRHYSAVVVELNRRFSALELRELERQQEKVEIPRRPESAVVCDTSQVEIVLESFASQPVECVSEITLTEAEAVEKVVMATRPQTQPPPVQAPLRVSTGGVLSSNSPSDSASAFANSPDTGATSSAVSTLDRDTVVLRNSRPSPQQQPQPQPRTSVATRQSVADTPQRASIAASQATLEAPCATESSARVLYATRMQAVEVTVFQERALVHRACSLQLPAGPTEICIKSLPHAIDKDSIRCAAPPSAPPQLS